MKEMQLLKWTYTKRYNIKAFFDIYPNSRVIFRQIGQYYFIYIVNWSEQDLPVLRSDLEKMELLLNRELGTEEAYLNRKSKFEQ